MSRYYGVDLHLESFNVAILDDNGSVPVYKKVSLKSNAIEHFISELTREDYIAVEASTNTFWFVSKVQNYVNKCHVINPYKFSIIGNATKKTDRIDALKIATRLKYYECYDKSEDEFPRVHIPPIEIQELRSLYTTYEAVKKQTIMTKNRIRSLLRQHGIFDFQGTNLTSLCVQEEILNGMPTESLAIQMKILVDLLRVQEEQKDAVKDAICRKGAIFYNEIRLLTSIRGVSPFLAIAFMTDIVTVERFKNAKHLCSYLRTAPRIQASGDSQQIGKINKASRTLTISLMTESVKHFVDSSTYMHNYYFKKRVSKSPGKVRVAVMRKMMVIMYKILCNNQLYYFKDERNHAAKMKAYDLFLKRAA